MKQKVFFLSFAVIRLWYSIYSCIDHKKKKNIFTELISSKTKSMHIFAFAVFLCLNTKMSRGPPKNKNVLSFFIICPMLLLLFFLRSIHGAYVTPPQNQFHAYLLENRKPMINCFYSTKIKKNQIHKNFYLKINHF